MPGPQDFLDGLAGIEDDEARTPEQLEEQALLEDEHEEGAVPEKPDPDDYDERDEDPAGHRPAAAAEPEPVEDKRVPLAELIAERKARQELARRLEALEQAQQQRAEPKPPEAAKPPEAEQEPDYLDDPKAWTEWKLRVQAQEIASLKEQSGKLDQETTQQRQMRDFQGAIQTREQEFVTENADYYDALNFAREKVARDLLTSAEAMGVEVTREQLRAELARQELATAASALQRGLSPAEVVYKIAKGWGYQAKAANGRGQPSPQNRATASRDLARGLPSGGANENDLTESESESNVPLEFLEARAERFGRRRN